jgi:hypothetical protein
MDLLLLLGLMAPCRLPPTPGLIRHRHLPKNSATILGMHLSVVVIALMTPGAAQHPPKEAIVPWQGLILNLKTPAAGHSRTRQLYPHLTEATAPSPGRGAMKMQRMSVCGSKRITANGRGALR